DHGKFGADVDGLVLTDLDRQEYARGRRRDFGVDLVRGYLEQRLVGLDGVALLLEPAWDGTLRHALTERRQSDGEGPTTAPGATGRRRCRRRVGLAGHRCGATAPGAPGLVALW